MKSVFKPLLIAGLLATVGLAAYSQSPMGMGMGDGDCYMTGAGGPMYGGMHHDRMGRWDPTRMQAMMDKRNAALKAQLKLTAAQEGAWANYTAAMKPPADMAARQAEHAELAKLPTPERIDKMKALRAQHMGEMTTMMDKHGEATKALYAVLTPEQKKIFDNNVMRKPRDGAHMGGMRDGKGPAPVKP
jgi:Spy/CpxP family protein refolding chaperone